MPLDITEERALVRYSVPEDASKEGATLAVLVTVARGVPTVETIIVQVYEGDRPIEQVTVETEWVTRYTAGEIDAALLREHMQIEKAS